MLCFAIEATAHTFGCALIDSRGNILADNRDMYKKEDGGIIPLEAAKHHENVKNKLIEETLKNLSNKKINLIAYSRGPGLAPCLLVGLKTAKELTKEFKVPLIGVNHAISHLTSGLLFTKAKDPVYVYVSGANTQILSLEGKRFRIIGETEDIGLGNALDKFGRGIGLGFPAGPKIEELAKKGRYIELQYTVKGMDLVFSGIVTQAIQKFKHGISKEDLCYSIQETLFSMLVEVTERALAHTGKKEVLLIGGVAANKRLCEMLKIMCEDRGCRFHAVPLKYSGDQAVMIGWEGILEYSFEKRNDFDKANIYPYERTDDVEIDLTSISKE
ncbi:tRNA (adenosine(37)-N6)-threonylcarbamoyltransferase complex transferase subunit TsaD [Candidatus Woesearchaeota archaeon]|nr:tRNA (adenosine(37)-N6)-threonylcarbamoyltransferase complex transferase subunit TsaD [Candidatus Woesearchaeota archaeon]